MELPAFKMLVFIGNLFYSHFVRNKSSKILLKCQIARKIVIKKFENDYFCNYDKRNNESSQIKKEVTASGDKLFVLF